MIFSFYPLSEERALGRPLVLLFLLGPFLVFFSFRTVLSPLGSATLSKLGDPSFSPRKQVVSTTSFFPISASSLPFASLSRPPLPPSHIFFLIERKARSPQMWCLPFAFFLLSQFTSCFLVFIFEVLKKLDTPRFSFFPQVLQPLIGNEPTLSIGDLFRSVDLSRAGIFSFFLRFEVRKALSFFSRCQPPCACFLLGCLPST